MRRRPPVREAKTERVAKLIFGSYHSRDSGLLMPPKIASEPRYQARLRSVWSKVIKLERRRRLPVPESLETVRFEGLAAVNRCSLAPLPGGNGAIKCVSL